MKNLITTFLFTVIYVSTYSQNTIHVVFTSSQDAENGAKAVHMEHDGNHLIALQNRSLGYVYDFLYFTSANSILTKPQSYLNTVSYIDWDQIGPQLSKEQAKEQIRELLSYDSIYFIDRNDMKAGNMRLIPAKRVIPAF